MDRSPSRDPEKGSSLSRFSSLPQYPTIPVNRQSAMSSPLSPQRHRTLERTNSVSILSGPTRVEPRHKIPIGFRTLSIEVSHSRGGLAGPTSGTMTVKDLAALEWHTLDPDEVCSRLGVSPAVGLDKEMAARRLQKDGKNAISPPPKNLPRKIFFYIFGGFGSLLFGASIICFIAWKPLGNPNPQASNLALAVILLVVISIQAIFNAWQDFSTGRVMASIGGLLPSQVLVLRDGQSLTVHASELVSGDIVKITLGSKVPADLRILECSSDLRFDRSILTGESKAVPASVNKTDDNFMESRNIALQGTLCTEGSGVGLCVGLGDRTVFGRIAKEASKERPSRTTLEKEISRFVITIASLAFLVALIIVILWAAWLRRSYPDFINVPTLLIDLVSCAVAFIPEGLPMCVTLSLTIIAGKMQKKNILCKSLSTVESLGCVSVICSDKTGTLTQNKMSCVNVTIGTSIVPIEDARNLAAQPSAQSSTIKVLASIAGVCNDALFEGEKEGRGDTPIDDVKINGDATDTGLLRFASKFVDVDGLRAHWSEKAKIAFNSKNKFAVKLLQPAADSKVHDTLLSPTDALSPNDYVLVVKGAPDVLLRRCAGYIQADGTYSLLDDAALASINRAQQDLAGRGQRVLLLAKKIVPAHALNPDIFSNAENVEETLNLLTSDLIVAGLTALVDPPRDDTAETVRICRGAGIRFLMVTGDFALTAAAIATQVGIITNPPSAVKHLSDLTRDYSVNEEKVPIDKDEPDRVVTSLVLSGPELLTMNESQWEQVLQFDEIVFARTSPQQKLQIVKRFQSAGCTVAVTGDGVNDAPALKQADVGVAVAGGSEVALEAADLILLDRFSAIVTGIESGRLCFENLRKTLLYLLPAGSFSELMPVIINILFGLPQALSNIQMILICVATDVLPALSLVFEKPEADLLLRKPRDPKKDHLVDFKVLGHAYFFLGILESFFSMLGAFYWGFHRHGIPFSSLWLKYGGYDVDPTVFAEALARSQSIYFFNLIIMQWFNLLSTRTRRLSIFQQSPISGRTKNVFIFPAMLLALGIGAFFSYIPSIQRVFDTRGVAAEFFFLPMAYGCIILLLDESRKWWVRRKPDGALAKIAW